MEVPVKKIAGDFEGLPPKRLVLYHFFEKPKGWMPDLWVFCHQFFPFFFYYYFRSFFDEGEAFVLAWLCDFIWESWELLMFETYAKIYDLDLNKPEMWPDYFKPETRFNSLINDPFFAGLPGILLAMITMWAFHLPPPRDGFDAGVIVQGATVIIANMEAGRGFRSLYFFPTIALGLFTIYSLTWNSLSFGDIWPILVIQYVLVVATSLCFFTPKPFKEPLFTMWLGMAIMAIIYFSYGLHNRL